jgi:hypothetical protein
MSRTSLFSRIFMIRWVSPRINTTGNSDVKLDASRSLNRELSQESVIRKEAHREPITPRSETGVRTAEKGDEVPEACAHAVRKVRAEQSDLAMRFRNVSFVLLQGLDRVDRPSCKPR